MSILNHNKKVILMFGNLTKYLTKIKRKSYRAFDGIWWKISKFSLFNSHNPTANITIGITTFAHRFKSCLIPLIKQLAILFPKCQIIVLANGDVDQIKQTRYLKELREFCSKYSNVQLIDFEQPVGLSKLWNMIMIYSKNRKVLILNDDVRLATSFDKFITNSGITDQDIATIRGSWSHFLISKSMFEKVGCFDERLSEIGGEDDDYAARCALLEIQIINYHTSKIAGKLKGKHKKLKVNSYGKDMVKQLGGYSTYNSRFIQEIKWHVSEKPFEGAIYVPNRKPAYWKLRDGMNTPDFYTERQDEK